MSRHRRRSRVAVNLLNLLATPGREKACRCGDPRDAHRHYRRGSDCSRCGCRRFRRRRRRDDALFAAFEREGAS